MRAAIIERLARLDERSFQQALRIYAGGLSVADIATLVEERSAHKTREAIRSVERRFSTLPVPIDDLPPYGETPFGNGIFRIAHRREQQLMRLRWRSLVRAFSSAFKRIVTMTIRS